MFGWKVIRRSELDRLKSECQALDISLRAVRNCHLQAQHECVRLEKKLATQQSEFDKVIQARGRKIGHQKAELKRLREAHEKVKKAFDRAMADPAINPGGNL